MSDDVLPAYDPDTTPEPFGLGAGISWKHPEGAPIAPFAIGETLLDADGKVRHIPPREDGAAIQLTASNDAT